MAKKKRPQSDDDDKPAAKGNMGLWIGLGAGGLVLLLCVCGGGGIGGYLIMGRSKDPIPGPDGGNPGPVPLAKGAGIKIISPAGDENLGHDPKWRANADLKSILPGGRWFGHGQGAFCIEFTADGRAKKGDFGNIQGAYRIQANKLELVNLLDVSKASPTKLDDQHYFCLANDDELALMQDMRFGSKLKPNEYVLVSKMYRMRVDGTGLGHARLIAPNIAKLKSVDAKERATACAMLKSYTSDSWTATPALIGVVENDPQTRVLALQALAQIGPRAKDALPALRKQLTSTDKIVVQEVQIAITAIERDQFFPWGGFKK